MAGYQIKVTMEGARPPMWRRLEIPNQITFEELHEILQTAFGWQDMHLHEFSFQYTQASVGDPEYAEYEESGLLADDFLHAGWIRYTYDFGDDWRHKIVLEKERPDYDKRCAQVVKFKRNNFEEDSGGIWLGDESADACAVSYDMAEVNETLKHIKCQVNSDARTAEDLGIQADQKKQEKEARDRALDLIKQMGKLMREIENVDQPAPVDLFAEKLKECWDDLADQGSWECKRIKTPMAELFEWNGIRHLLNLLKYLAEENATKIPLSDVLALQVAKCVKEHPEYLVLVFPVPVLNQYVSWFRKGQAECLPEHHYLMAFAMWGLMKLELTQKGEKLHLQIGLPDDAESVVTYLEEHKLENLKRSADKIWERIHGMLQCYGFIEIRALHSQYETVFGRISWEDFQRHLYLCGSFCGEAVTGGNVLNLGEEESEGWAALSKDIAQTVTKEDSGLRDSLEYAEFTRKQFLEMVRVGYNAVYPQWDILLEVFCHMQMEDWEAEKLLDMLYEGIQLGLGMSALLEEFENEEWMQPEDWKLLQHALCRCWSETGIPQLKGHSRAEIAAQTGQSLFAVASQDGYLLEDYAVGTLGAKANGSEKPMIHPDDVCPCGSGKRYRQCCGRRK